jgi:hypothetical protein
VTKMKVFDAKNIMLEFALPAINNTPGHGFLHLVARGTQKQQKIAIDALSARPMSHFS